MNEKTETSKEIEVDPIVRRLIELIHKKASGEVFGSVDKDDIHKFKPAVRKSLLMPNEDLLRERSKVLMKRSNLSRSERDYCLKIGTELYFELCRLQEVSDQKKRDIEQEVGDEV